MKPSFLILALGLTALGLTAIWPGADASAAGTDAPAPAEKVDRTKPPAAEPLPQIAFPVPVTETLENGLRVFVLHSSRKPTVTFRLLVKGGGSLDGSTPGLAELTANLLNKGTEELSASEFAKKTDFIGASVEAGAGDDYVAINATGLSNYSGELLRFLRDVALRPAFRQAELAQQKQNLISNLVQKKSSPEDLSERLRDRLLFGSHPYGAFATPESVQALTRDQLVRFHDTYFVPSNATLVVVGDIDPAAILDSVKTVLGEWKPGKVPAAAAGTGFPAFPKIEGVSIHLVDRPGSVQSNIVVAAPGVARNNPDVPELAVVNSILGGGFSGRLFANLREKHGFTYGAYSSFSLRRLGGAFSATAEVRNAVTGPAITEILNELTRISAEPIPEPEVKLQRQYLAGNFLLSLENDERTAERVQETELYGLPADFYKTYAKRLVAVTPEKASELAKTWSRSGKRVTSACRFGVTFSPKIVRCESLLPRPMSPST